MKAWSKRARYAEKERRVNENELQAISFGMAILCNHLRSPTNARNRWGKKRLNGLVRGIYRELEEQFERYRGSDDEQFSAENAPILYTGLRNQILALDVDAAGIEGEYAFPERFAGWRNPRDVEKRASRYTLLQNREKIFRSFWYAAMLVLWREHGWGAGRLNRLYRAVRREYFTVFRCYLECTAAHDTWVAGTIEQTNRMYENFGVKL